jgi:hypothetical protein
MDMDKLRFDSLDDKTPLKMDARPFGMDTDCARPAVPDRRDQVYEAWYGMKTPTLGRVFDAVNSKPGGNFTTDEIKHIIETFPIRPGTPAPIFIGLDDGDYVNNIKQYCEGLLDYVYVNPTTFYYREWLEGWPHGRHTVVVASSLHRGSDRVYGWTGMSMIVSGERVLKALNEFIQDAESS